MVVGSAVGAAIRHLLPPNASLVPPATENDTYCHNLPPFALSVNSLSQNPSAIPVVVEQLNIDELTMTVRAKANESDKRHGKWVTQARDRLAARREEKPLTKAGQIRALWWEIEGALADGQSLKSVRDWLEDEGVVVTRATLSSYKRRFRRREEANRKAHALEAFVRQIGGPSQMPGPVHEASPEPPRAADQPIRDPFAQARRALEKTFDIRTIHGDGDPTGRNLV